MICDENEENNLSQQIVESGVKSRKISIFKEFLRHDKNIICLPRQDFLFCLNLLILCGFPHNRRVHYNDFTTFEKCSDMTEMGDSTIPCIPHFFICRL